MIWLINVDDQWEFSNSCIKFALAGWFVSSHVLEVERRFLLRSASRGGPLGVAGATACYRVAAVLNFQFPVSRSSCMINAPSFWRWTYSTAIYRAIPNMHASCHNILCAVRISCIWQLWRLQRKFFPCRVQCNVWTYVNIELKQILPSSHSKLALDT